MLALIAGLRKRHAKRWINENWIVAETGVTGRFKRDRTLNLAARHNWFHARHNQRAHAHKSRAPQGVTSSITSRDDMCITFLPRRRDRRRPGRQNARTPTERFHFDS